MTVTARKGKSGGGSARTPVEAPNSLRSRQHVRTLHVIGEGEIAGVDAVYFDDVPIVDPSGHTNYSATVEVRTGTQTQSAIPMVGLEAEQPVRIELKAGQPTEHAITDADVDAARITVSVPQLSKTNTSNGDIGPATVEFRAEVRVGSGAWQPLHIGSSWVACSTAAPAGSSAIQGRFTVVDRNQEAYSYEKRAGRDSTKLVTGMRPGRTDVAVDVRSAGGSWVQVAAKALPAGGADSWVDFYAEGSQLEARLRIVTGSGSGVLAYASALMPSGVVTLTDKTMSPAQVSYSARLPAAQGQPRYIRLTRITPDSTSSALQNRLIFDSVTWLWDERLRYPNTALVAISTDAEQFNGLPRVSFDVRGQLIRVPNNYDPISRSYAGSWDGTFKRAWSDNPAWCWYELVTNPRFGLGDYLPDALVDKWALYAIGRYCDELVPDGYGGVEPRYTCNLYLGGEQAEAWKVVQDMLSIFRAIGYWAGGTLGAVQDAPRAASYAYSNATVVEGSFAYQTPQADQRYNVASVAWNDPAQQYKLARELVERPDLVAKWGRVQQVDLTAVGCTSRGQARRLGMWALYAEQETVSFVVGADGALPLPGDIIDIVDANRAGARFGGRLRAGCTTSLLQLDAPVAIATGGVCVMGVTLPDGSYTYVNATLAAGSYTALPLDAALPQVPLAGAGWALSTPDVAPQKYRVMSVAESDEGTYAITGLRHDPEKFGFIDFGLPDLEQPEALDVLAQGGIAGVKVTESLYETPAGVAAARITLSWTISGPVASALVRFKPPGGGWQERATRASSIDIDGVAAGAWEFAVYPINLIGLRGRAATLSANVVGLAGAPAALMDLRLDVVSGVSTLSWAPHPDLDVKIGGVISIRHARQQTAGWAQALPLIDVAGRANSATVPLLAGKYLVRAVDSSGTPGPIVEVLTDGRQTLPENVVITLDEGAGGFVGTGSGYTVAGGYLRISAAGMWDDIPDIDAAGVTDDYGGSVGSFEYRFAQRADLQSVQDVRLSAEVQPYIYSGSTWWDDFADFDAVAATDGQEPSGSQLRVEVRATQSDPALGDWGAWSPMVAGDYRGRAFEFRLIGSVSTADDWIEVRKAIVTVDVPDRDEAGNDLAVPATGLQVVFSRRYLSAPALSITAQGLSPGDYVDVTAKTTDGFTVFIRAASGQAVAGRTIDYLARGF